MKLSRHILIASSVLVAGAACTIGHYEAHKKQPPPPEGLIVLPSQANANFTFSAEASSAAARSLGGSITDGVFAPVSEGLLSHDWTPRDTKPPSPSAETKHESGGKNAVIEKARRLNPDDRVELLLSFEPFPTLDDQWRGFRSAGDAERERFVAWRKDAIAEAQAPFREWLVTKEATIEATFWLVNGLQISVPARNVEEIVQRAEVRHVSDSTGSAPRPLRAANTGYGAGETRHALRVDNLYRAGFSGNAGSRSGAGGGDNRIKIGIVETRNVYPLREHPGFKNAADGGVRLVERTCGLGSCSATTQTQLGYDPDASAPDASPFFDHGTDTTKVAVGSIEHGEDPSFPGGTFTSDQTLRSGLLSDAVAYTYEMHGDSTETTLIQVLGNAMLDGVDVLNISYKMSGECFIGDPALNPYSMSLASQALNNALSSGVVIVGSVGNDGINQPSDSTCRIGYPASRPEVLGVGAVSSTDWTKAYNTLPIAAYTSRGGVPMYMSAGFAVNQAGVDVVAPGTHGYPYIRLAGGGVGYGDDSFVSGTSVAGPPVAASIGALRQAFNASAPNSMNDGRTLLAVSLLMGDGWDADTGTIDGNHVSTLSGTGRFKAHWPGSASDPMPNAFTWRTTPVMHSGDSYTWPINLGAPLPGPVSEYKFAAFNTPITTDINKLPDFDYYLENSCPAGGGPPVVLASNAGYDSRTVFRLTPAQFAGKCLQMRVYAYNVPSSGATLTAADWFHAGPVDDPTTVSQIPFSGWWGESFASSPWPGVASAGSSGNRSLAEATNPPSVGASQNGISPPDFDGTNDSLTTSVNANSFWDSKAWTAVALVRADTALAPSSFAYQDQAIITDTQAVAGLSISSSGVRGWTFDTSAGYHEASTSASTGAWHLVQLRYTGHYLSIRVDSGNWVSTVVGSSWPIPAMPLRIGRNYNNTRAFDGRIAEVMTANYSLSDPQLEIVKSYINGRWGLSL